jgi:hypothetical protein
MSFVCALFLRRRLELAGLLIGMDGRSPAEALRAVQDRRSGSDSRDVPAVCTIMLNLLRVIVFCFDLITLPLGSRDHPFRTLLPFLNTPLCMFVEMEMTFPNLTETPSHHPDCCLGLSTVLMTFLKNQLFNLMLPKHEADSGKATSHALRQNLKIALSIGSGTGLLERLLQRSIDSTDVPNPSRARWQVEGVEVYARSPVNKHNLDTSTHIVRGSWDLCPRAFENDTKVWLFIYPRQPRLVRTYCERLRRQTGSADNQASALELIIWTGPVSDWLDYEDVFHGLLDWVVSVIPPEKAGIMEWESLVVLRKSKRQPRSP